VHSREELAEPSEKKELALKPGAHRANQSILPGRGRTRKMEKDGKKTIITH